MPCDQPGSSIYIGISSTGEQPSAARFALELPLKEPEASDDIFALRQRGGTPGKGVENRSKAANKLLHQRWSQRKGLIRKLDQSRPDHLMHTRSS